LCAWLTTRVPRKAFLTYAGDDSKGAGCRSALSEFPYNGHVVSYGIIILETAVGRARPLRY